MTVGEMLMPKKALYANVRLCGPASESAEHGLAYSET